MILSTCRFQHLPIIETDGICKIEIFSIVVKKKVVFGENFYAQLEPVEVENFFISGVVGK